MRTSIENNLGGVSVKVRSLSYAPHIDCLTATSLFLFTKLFYYVRQKKRTGYCW